MEIYWEMCVILVVVQLVQLMVLCSQALLLCFKLQESRIAVVSSTAAATLRQLVMFVVDKVVDEDRRDDVDPQLLSLIKLPDGSETSLGPSACDAYAVFEDLCLLANNERPNFLKLEFLHKTFALELIESVLTNYHDLFRKVFRACICFAMITHNGRSYSIRSYFNFYKTIYALFFSKVSRNGQSFLSHYAAPALFSSF
jgi:hypothetical protein